MSLATGWVKCYEVLAAVAVAKAAGDRANNRFCSSVSRRDRPRESR
jgi:hypothetical protein